MAAAAIDVLSYLPCPPNKNNTGASDLYDDQLFAYAAGAVVVVTDVRTRQIACVLEGAAHSASITAIAWCLKGNLWKSLQSANLRLASGDTEGRVIVWDVAAVAPVWAIEDASGGALRRGVVDGRLHGAVSAVGWVGQKGKALAVVLQPGMAVIWDPQGGGMMWRQDFSSGEPVCCCCVDPLDPHRMCMWGNKGGLMVMELRDGADVRGQRVSVQQYKVDVGAEAQLQIAFSKTQDLLIVLLAKDIIIFDLEFGRPAASTPLRPGCAPFSKVLGSFKHPGVRGRSVVDNGMDFLFILHKDGAVSSWQCRERKLNFNLLQYFKITPPPSRLTSNSSFAIVSISAQLWTMGTPSPLGCCHQEMQETTPDITSTSPSHSQLNFQPTDPHDMLNALHGKGSDVPSGHLPPNAAAASESLLVMAVTANGNVWQWDVPFPIEQEEEESSVKAESPESPTSTLPAPSWPQPSLLGLLHTLPSPVTCFSVCPKPIRVNATEGECVIMIAAATTSGTLELMTLQRGALQPLALHVTVGLSAHKEAVRGLRWLGPTPRLVSFSSEKTANGFKNNLLLTDMRNRCTVLFREAGVENVPLTAIRSSPEGRYLIVLLKGAPSEVWAVGGHQRPVRVRVVDLPFTAVEWVTPYFVAGAEGDAGAPALWRRSMDVKEAALQGYPPPSAAESLTEQSTDFPEERLAFALADGRGGVLSVKGRKISDTKPRRPTWGFLSGPECVATAIAGWGPFVFLGDADGNLMRWDITSGKMSAVATGGLGAVRKIYCAPSPHGKLATEDNEGSSPVMRIAVLFQSGSFGVWEVDTKGELRSYTASIAVTRKLGRVTDLEWLPFPEPIGGGAMLAVSLEEGALAVLDVCQTAKHGNIKERALNISGYLGGSWPFLQGALPRPAAFGSCCILPHSWVMLLRWLMQRGAPPSLLRQWSQGGPSISDEDPLEAALWSLLPASCKSVWINESQRMGWDDKDTVQEVSNVATILDSFVDDIRDELPPQSSIEALMDDQAADASSHQQTSPGESHHVTPSRSIKQREATTGRSAASSKAKGGAGGACGTGLFHSLAAVVGSIGQMRADGQLMYDWEWQEYESAIGGGSMSHRMSVAAQVVGDKDEARFWFGLPSTLAAAQRELAAESESESPLPSDLPSRPVSPTASCSDFRGNALLWDPLYEVHRAKARLHWHESMMKSVGGESDALQSLRLMEYVCLGDYQTAVGYLLASTPEATARYYRDALTTLALAAACDAQMKSRGRGRAPPLDLEDIGVNKTLHVQAAKVITANASTFGDALLGLPLLCSIGLFSEAVSVLHDAGHWRSALTLACHALSGADRAAALERWAQHVLHVEGRLWEAVSVCCSLGNVSLAVQMLDTAGPPDAAHAFIQVCRECGIRFSPSSPDPTYARNGRPLLFEISQETEAKIESKFDSHMHTLMTLL